MNRLLFFLISLALSGQSFAQSAKQLMHDHADQVKSLFQTYYAPSEWKARFAGWHLDTEIQALHNQIDLKANTAKDYHILLNDFFNSTRDYHVGVSFLSTESARLPIQIVEAENRFFIVDINRRALPLSKFPARIGDEITTIGNRSVEDFVMELQQTTIDGSPLTNRTLAVNSLFSHSGARGQIVPSQGPIPIGVKSSSGISLVSLLEWQHTEESPALLEDNFSPLNPIDFMPIASLLNNSAFSLGPKVTVSGFNQEMSIDLAEDFDPSMAGEFRIGASKSFVPDLGNLVQRLTPGFFNGAIFELLGGKKLGFIRIPSYSGGAMQTLEFVQKIALLEAQTDILVIDQVNNPGGSVPFLYSLASALTDKPLVIPKHKIALTQREVLSAQRDLASLSRISTDAQAVAAIGPTIGGYPVSLTVVENLRNAARFTIDEWKRGNRLTNPTHIAGVETIQPHPTARYTKPIIMLINELDFSGGDFLPAILQDNKRALIFGQKTAGAGGFVLSARFPNLLGVGTMRFTGSLAERVDGQPLENLGVEPDVPYALTAADIQNGFTGYRNAVIKQVHRLLNSAGNNSRP